MSSHDNTQAALDAGVEIGKLRALGEIKRVMENGLPFILTPQGYTFAELEKYLPTPLAVRSAVKLANAESFVAYVNRFKDADTVVFADLEGRKFEAVLDYHQKDVAKGAAPRWGKHRATFACATTPAWNEWSEADERAMSQVDFARFIEDRIPHIAEPAGAKLLELCLTLEAKKDVQFRSSTRLANGETQFRYEETITGTAGSNTGTVDIPTGFILALEPFHGVGQKRLDARFRYRIDRGVLSMSYELVRPDDVLQAAFDELVALLRKELGDTPLLAGAAPVIA